MVDQVDHLLITMLIKKMFWMKVPIDEKWLSFSFKFKLGWSKAGSLQTYCRLWRIPSLSKSHFLSHQMSNLTTVPHIRLAQLLQSHPSLLKHPLYYTQFTPLLTSLWHKNTTNLKYKNIFWFGWQRCAELLTTYIYRRFSCRCRVSLS